MREKERRGKVAGGYVVQRWKGKKEKEVNTREGCLNK